jgi:hypothetical protein
MRERTSIWILMALWLGCEDGKDATALIAFGVLLGWILCEAAT